MGKKRLASPDWLEAFREGIKKRPEVAVDPEVTSLVKKANAEYLHWERFRFQRTPAGVPPELVWALVKLSRNTTREILPLRDTRGTMSFCLYREQIKNLSFIDSYSSGVIASATTMPNEDQEDRLVISGLIEEAISSSQIEGASTTRKVAKAMIELKRDPRNKDERMIFNNYRAMAMIEEWKEREFDAGFLLELHRILTEGTMEVPADVGRFRDDSDEVVVSDRATGAIVHRPPEEREMRGLLKQLFEFANAEEPYIHPFIKASILHFCIGYIHPFVDGNGRCARALFYWHLIKKGYWMFKFLPISLQIKKKDWRPGYDRAFQQAESDELDLTYFINYKMKLACNAIEDLKKYLIRQQKKAYELKHQLVATSEINQRQLDLIAFLQSHPAAEIDVTFHKERFGIVYETARSDLRDLVQLKILLMRKRGKKYVFSRGDRFPSR